MRFTEPEPGLPTDSDIDLEIPSQRTETHWPVIGAISAGGVLGALARYGISQAWPTPTGGFPWATFVINVTGSLLIGALMVVVTDIFTRQRLLRPFLGVGVLGGYTTFSTYAVEIRNLIAAGAPGMAAFYLVTTLAAACVAVFVGMTAARAVTWLVTA
ncbi:fluoride efflux transporter FluC [Asanoa iriomotensis]|uniref:Fluoride-specific ion channel FluC n=1 Tax=Asanoa iriomotensis TaxID=234613 RepID=A0ABQ4CBG4_9ACTN|nr:CrcB family protein [Asanoa iriomotensis]GIF60111.1 putative fluoride ion transporter CrcB 1 [Asanoa iriomotensis]